MSKGSKIVQIRFGKELLAEIEADVAKRSEHYATEEHTLSDWVRTACREYLRKRKAGRKTRPKKRPRAQGGLNDV